MDRLPYDLADALVPTRDGDVEVYADVRYAVVRGFRPLLMHLRVPRRASGRVPVVLWIHGGGWVEGSHVPCVDDILDLPRIWDALTDGGAAVASVQYRYSGEAIFPACLHDVMAAVRWLRGVGPGLGLDPDRIGVLGESAGGHLAAFLAMNTRRADLVGEVGLRGPGSAVQAAAAWYAPTDFPRLREHAGPASSVDHGGPSSGRSALLGAVLDDHVELGRWASPATYAGPGAAPLLLAHGDVDVVVPVRQSVELHRRLRDDRVPTELVLVRGGDHVFVGGDPSWAITRTVEFLLGHLRGADGSGSSR